MLVRGSKEQAVSMCVNMFNLIKVITGQHLILDNIRRASSSGRAISSRRFLSSTPRCLAVTPSVSVSRAQGCTHPRTHRIIHHTHRTDTPETSMTAKM